MSHGVESRDSECTSPSCTSGRIREVFWCVVILFALFTSAVCLLEFGSDLGLLSNSWRPGIGDVEKAQSKIKTGMTKDEVRSVLGRPHEDEGDEWIYWETRFADAKLLVRFGDDNRVTSSAWWLR